MFESNTEMELFTVDANSLFLIILRKSSVFHCVYKYHISQTDQTHLLRAIWLKRITYGIMTLHVHAHTFHIYDHYNKNTQLVERIVQSSRKSHTQDATNTKTLAKYGV